MNSRIQFPFLFLTREKSFKIPFHKNSHYLKREELLKATLLPPEGGGREGGRLHPEVQPLTLLYRIFSLTWPASTQIYWNKRKRLHKKRVQIPEDWYGTPTWPPFHYFGTPMGPPWRHVKTLYSWFNKGCFGRSYCLVVTKVNHCIVSYAQMPNVQLPMTNYQRNLFWFSRIPFFTKKVPLSYIFFWQMVPLFTYLVKNFTSLLTVVNALSFK